MIKNKIFFLLILVLSFLFQSCSVSKPYISSKAGVVITFDDYFVKEWMKTDSILSKYNWKATYCVSNFNELSTEDIANLKKLQNQGNEIAGHGFKHINAKEYSKNNNKKSI